MKIEKVDGIWLPIRHTLLHIDHDSKFLLWCNSQQKKFSGILDINAEFGLWANSIEKYAKKIYCFEGNKTNFKCLHHNTTMNEKISIYNQNVSFVIDQTVSLLELSKIDLININIEDLTIEILETGMHTLDNCQYLIVYTKSNIHDFIKEQLGFSILMTEGAKTIYCK